MNKLHILGFFLYSSLLTPSVTALDRWYSAYRYRCAIFYYYGTNFSGTAKLYATSSTLSTKTLSSSERSKISSLKISEGCKVKLRSSTGEFQWFYGDVSDLNSKGWSDRAYQLSLGVMSSSCKVRLVNSSYYSIDLSISNPDLSSFAGFGNEAKRYSTFDCNSYNIVGYPENDYQGAEYDMTNPNTVLNFDLGIKSVKISRK